MEDLLGIHTGLLYQMAAGLPGGPRGWAVNRLIFRDWWHWRDHELQAALGNIALTGQNEGGKSSLLALAATLLDGDTSPRRLDPSGSADRYLYYFLLGKEQDDPEDPEVFAYKARVGYLVMEFRHGDTGRYLSIGMGVDASRAVPGGKIRDWWGFILPKARVGPDFDVRGKDGNCLPYGEFRQLPVLGPVVDGEGDVPAGTTVLTTKRQVYRRQVNDHLFQMSDDDYRALIEVLLSARRPKMAQAIQEGPEKVCQLLRDSLPPLPTEQIENLSQVINNLESHQRDLKDLEDHARWVEGIDQRHYALVESLVQQAAAEYGGRIETYRQLTGQIQRWTRDRERARQAVAGLEHKTGELTGARSRAQAELDAQKVDVADLPQRLQQARTRAGNALTQQGTVGANLERIKAEMDGLNLELNRLRKDFAEERNRLALRLADLARSAESFRWPGAVENLQAARRGTLACDAGDPPGQLAAARPDAGFLTGESEERVRLGRKVRESLAARKDKEKDFRLQDGILADWRQKHLEAVDAVTRAGERLSTAREALAGQLEDWASRHPELELPDHRLATVRGAVLDLQVVPESGFTELVATLRAHAAVRTRELRAAARAALVRAGLTGEKIDALAGEMRQLAEDGPRPLRSDIRTFARTSGIRSLYEWIRFRPEVEPDVADLVEAALMESGILDLAVAGEEDPAADAWLLSARPVSGPSLTTLLVPEEGAPPPARQALAAIGWGEGPGEHWVAADGHWRHGLAEGRVAPWLREPPGLVGAHRRQRTLEGRLAAMREAKLLLETEQAREEAEAGRYQEALAMLEGALDEVEGLKWQSVFRAIRDFDDSQAAEKLAQEAVEGAKAPARTARLAFEAAGAAYLAAVRQAPGSEGLDDGGLESLIGRLKEFAGDIRSLAQAYQDLERWQNEHARKTAELAKQEQLHKGWQGGGDAARQELEAAQAAVAVLEERINRPDVVAAINAAIRLKAEVERLDQEIDQAGQDRNKQEIEAGRAQALLAEKEPEVETARQLQGQARSVLLARLALHPDLAPEAGRLAAEAGPTRASLQSLPHPVEDPVQLADAIEERRADLMDWVRKAGDDLQDYGLSTDKTYDRISFRDEQRQPQTPGALYEHLQAGVEKTRGLIDEEERSLYEEIICNDLVDGLIDLMTAAGSFTERMNKKLAGLQASSGAYFHFKLDLLADSVPGVQVGRHLREQDSGAKWLSGERRQRLAGLIRSEVERARQEARAQNRTIGYLEAIQETLDYRQWYAFHIFRQTGSKSEQLRNRGFGALSGFARSWTLAVPVIAAVAARYDASRAPDVPRLVFLDEIFAGFDAGNQATYLRYLQGLDLNWIIADPDDLPYSDDLPAVMSYQMYLASQIHTAYPTLWDGRKVTDPAEVAAQVTKMAGEDGREGVGT